MDRIMRAFLIEPVTPETMAAIIKMIMRGFLKLAKNCQRGANLLA